MFSLFQSKEVELTLRAIGQAKIESREVAAVGIGDIWREVETAARMKSATVDAIRKQKWTPEELAWQIIANVTWDNLISGRHHVYRGVVGTSGLGLQPMFNLSMDRLSALGRLSPSEAMNEKFRLTKEIAKVG